MPDIDRIVDIKVYSGAGTVTAEIPLSGHASQHWLAVFHKLVSQRREEPRPHADDREDRTWVIVMLPGARTDSQPKAWLDAVSTLVGEANAMEQESYSGTAETKAAVLDWWADQRIELDRLRRELKDIEAVLWPSYWALVKGWLGVFGPPTIRRPFSPIFIVQVYALFNILCFAVGARLIFTTGPTRELGIAMVVGSIFAIGSFVAQLFSIAYGRTNEIAQQITGSQKINDLKQLAGRREAIRRQIRQRAGVPPGQTDTPHSF